MQAIQKLTGVSPLGDIKDYFKLCDEVPHELVLPFWFKDFIVVYEKVSVVHEIFNPKPSNFLLDLLADAPDAPFLLTDPGYTSSDSLFVATQSEDSLYNTWYDHMVYAKFIVNEHPKYGKLFAAALTSFNDV